MQLKIRVGPGSESNSHTEVYLQLLRLRTEKNWDSVESSKLISRAKKLSEIENNEREKIWSSEKTTEEQWTTMSLKIFWDEQCKPTFFDEKRLFELLDCRGSELFFVGEDPYVLRWYIPMEKCSMSYSRLMIEIKAVEFNQEDKLVHPQQLFEFSSFNVEHWDFHSHGVRYLGESLVLFLFRSRDNPRQAILYDAKDLTMRRIRFMGKLDQKWTSTSMKYIAQIDTNNSVCELCDIEVALQRLIRRKSESREYTQRLVFNP